MFVLRTGQNAAHVFPSLFYDLIFQLLASNRVRCCHFFQYLTRFNLSNFWYIKASDAANYSMLNEILYMFLVFRSRKWYPFCRGLFRNPYLFQCQVPQILKFSNPLTFLSKKSWPEMGSISPVFEQELGTINFVENAQISDSIVPCLVLRQLKHGIPCVGTCGILGSISPAVNKTMNYRIAWRKFLGEKMSSILPVLHS